MRIPYSLTVHKTQISEIKKELAKIEGGSFVVKTLKHDNSNYRELTIDVQANNLPELLEVQKKIKTLILDKYKFH